MTKPGCGPDSPHPGGLLLLTDRTAHPRPLVQTLELAAQAGVRAVVLRERDLPAAERWDLAAQLVSRLGPYGVRLWVSWHPGDPTEPPAGVHGWHRGGPDPGSVEAHGCSGRGRPGRVGEAAVSAAGRSGPGGMRPAELGHADSPLPWGRSCHSLEELANAAVCGAEYATFSPVFESISKPGYGPPASGVRALGRVCAAVPQLPVIALGGVTPESVALCIRAGAAGVAVLGAVMAADDPGTVVAELLSVLADATGKGE